MRLDPITGHPIDESMLNKIRKISYELKQRVSETRMTSPPINVQYELIDSAVGGSILNVHATRPVYDIVTGKDLFTVAIILDGIHGAIDQDWDTFIYTTTGYRVEMPYYEMIWSGVMEAFVGAVLKQAYPTAHDEIDQAVLELTNELKGNEITVFESPEVDTKQPLEHDQDPEVTKEAVNVMLEEIEKMMEPVTPAVVSSYDSLAGQNNPKMETVEGTVGDVKDILGDHPDGNDFIEAIFRVRKLEEQLPDCTKFKIWVGKSPLVFYRYPDSLQVVFDNKRWIIK